MIHPSRRRAALLPARRGMRAPWLRCRALDEGVPMPPDATDPVAFAHGDPGAHAPTAAAPGATALAAGDPVITAPIRPAFNRRVF